MMIKMRLAAAAAAIMLFTAGCGTPAATSSSAPTAEPTLTAKPTATAAPTAQPTATPASTPAEKTIGAKASGETVRTVVLENATGQDITGISVKDSSLEAFPDNLLAAEDVFIAGEKRTLFYDTAAALAANESQTADGRVLEPQYDIQITLKDGNSYVLHAFPFGSVDACAVLAADGVAYIEYTSDSGQKISTSGAELAILDAQDDTEYENYQAEDDYTDYGTDDYEEPDYQEPSYEEPQYEEPSYEEPAGGSDDGCINDALFN